MVFVGICIVGVFVVGFVLRNPLLGIDDNIGTYGQPKEVQLRNLIM